MSPGSLVGQIVEEQVSILHEREKGRRRSVFPVQPSYLRCMHVNPLTDDRIITLVTPTPNPSGTCRYIYIYSIKYYSIKAR